MQKHKSNRVPYTYISLNQENTVPRFNEYISDYFKKVLTITNGKINGFRGAAELTGIPPNTPVFIFITHGYVL